ncbi:ABC transporter ATP-binding protein [Kineosporia sp. R_H_3]|uniref:ABC transporter ATP-binding protein n=1 Tax=Kineosporia sp. R_H_3 TaxID=1961848 RepID=UPI000B4BC82E|nr:ABC transporter ATP-binding protein [Kineosporia sp. R_H_3]
MAGHQAWVAIRSYSRDPKVADRKLAPGTWRRILSYARPYRRLITVFLGLVVLDAVFVVVTPLLFRKIVDDGVSVGDRRLVVTVALVVAGLAVLDALAGLVQRWMSSRIGEGLIYDLRTQVFGHVLRQPIAFFTRAQTGALVSRLNNDVIGAQQAFTSTLSGVVSNVVSLVLVTVAMLVLSWPITLAALLLLPVFLLPARRVGRRLQTLTRESMQLNAELGSRMTERFNVAGALLVKLFGTVGTEDAEFSRRAGRVRDIGVKIAMSNRVFFTSLTLVASLATAIVYGVGGVLAIGGTLSVGTLIALAALLGRLYGPLTALSNVRIDVMTALVSFERVFEVLDLPPLVTEKPGAATLPKGPLAVELRDVRFGYPGADEVSLASLEQVAVPDRGRGEEVLHGLSLRAEAGQLVALVGPSGAGKTTITSLVARLYDATSGAVRLGDHDVRDVTLESLHANVGVVTQEAHLFHDTIRANLDYARPGATQEQMVSALRDAQIWDLVQSLPEGLDTVVGDRGHRLSGGEKQRIALARLLLKAPGVVVLDEATAHLDSESEAAVQRALDGALAGRTAIVIAHRLSTVRQADLICVVDDGRVVEQGRHAELLARGGLYSDLYRTQFADQPLAG